jgi:hypothetical protein
MDERFYSFYKKHYRAGARFVAQHRQALKKIGLNEETAMIVNWGSTKLDTDCLERILRDEDEEVEYRTPEPIRGTHINYYPNVMRRCVPKGTKMTLS